MIKHEEIKTLASALETALERLKKCQEVLQIYLGRHRAERGRCECAGCIAARALFSDQGHE